MTSAFGRFDHIRAVLFDLDGTLVDSAPDLAGAVDGMRVKRGLPSLPLVDYRPMAGAGARGMLGIAFGVAPNHPDFNDLREEFFVAYEDTASRAAKGTPPCPSKRFRTRWRGLAGTAPEYYTQR